MQCEFVCTPLRQCLPTHCIQLPVVWQRCTHLSFPPWPLSCGLYQTIDGFGFFGAQGPWWGWHSQMTPAEYYSDAWVALALDDLGITVWRNELYAEEGPNGPSQVRASV